MSEPRTWTLGPGGLSSFSAVADWGPRIRPDERVIVIEKAAYDAAVVERDASIVERARQSEHLHRLEDERDRYKAALQVLEREALDAFNRDLVHLALSPQL